MDTKDPRIEQIMEQILRFARSDFRVRIPVSGKGDELDAIIAGMNTLGEQMDEKAGSGPDFRTLFESSPGLYLVLSTDLKIVAVSNAYLEATMTKREEITGRHLFEVFPDNPDDPNATGVANLRASLNRVLKDKKPDRMDIQKYDIPWPSGEGFEERYWSPLNVPVFGQRGVVDYIIHQVKDVTDFVLMREKEKEHARLNMELKKSAQALEDYEARINALLEVLLKYSVLDFSEKMQVSDRGDEIDAIAVGLNTLGEELQMALAKEKEHIRKLEAGQYHALRKRREDQDHFTGRSQLGYRDR